MEVEEKQPEPPKDSDFRHFRVGHLLRELAECRHLASMESIHYSLFILYDYMKSYHHSITNSYIILLDLFSNLHPHAADMARSCFMD